MTSYIFNDILIVNISISNISSKTYKNNRGFQHQNGRLKIGYLFVMVFKAILKINKLKT